MPITLFGYTCLTCTSYLLGGKAQIDPLASASRSALTELDHRGSRGVSGGYGVREEGGGRRKAGGTSKRTLERENGVASMLRHKLTISGRTGSCLDTPLLNCLPTPLSWISRLMLHASSLTLKSPKLPNPLPRTRIFDAIRAPCVLISAHSGRSNSLLLHGSSAQRNIERT